MTSRDEFGDELERDIRLILHAQEHDEDEQRPEPPRLSAPLASLNARGLWFQARTDVLGRVYQVAVVARSLLGLHAIGVNIVLVMPRAERPWLVTLACLVIICWTAFTSLCLMKPSWRRPVSFVVDCLVTLTLVLLTPLAVPPGGAPLTLAGYWLCGAPIYAAIFWSTAAGVVSSVTLGGGLVVVPSHFTLERAGMAFITILTASCVGVLITQFREIIVEQERERIKAASLAERERLSRIVHDGALQVLALVEREGPALGPVGVRLATLARESESQLRVHLQDRDVVNVARQAQVDLASALDKYSSARVTVSTMAGEVLVARYLVEEIENTVHEILKNVRRHAGDGAQAWILLDQEVDDEVIIFVRDNGTGMTAAAAQRAAENGRFGIRDSIIGRISAIGGSAVLKSAPGAGTEWELRVPIDVE
ncbi:sensor histidine kinase [uncultured Tessaracoccus sp.]|uniref:sensor histidine kinase n=1 Tax=uncultured Tessaracoccus sp. TaxID=905023 RepID=UPI0026190ABE|nr:ATP-binding protein [uncultured Tessaracoccus sp.]